MIVYEIWKKKEEKKKKVRCENVKMNRMIVIFTELFKVHLTGLFLKHLLPLNILFPRPLSTMSRKVSLTKALTIVVKYNY